MKAGMKVFGDAGVAAVVSEIRDNLHGRGALEPVKREQVTHDKNRYNSVASMSVWMKETFLKYIPLMWN